MYRDKGATFALSKGLWEDAAESTKGEDVWQIDV